AVPRGRTQDGRAEGRLDPVQRLRDGEPFHQLGSSGSRERREIEVRPRPPRTRRGIGRGLGGRRDRAGERGPAVGGSRCPAPAGAGEGLMTSDGRRSSASSAAPPASGNGNDGKRRSMPWETPISPEAARTAGEGAANFAQIKTRVHRRILERLNLSNLDKLER